MPVKSGAGAAVSSGADYQARVAAYLIAAHCCTAPIGSFDLSTLVTIGFETAESVDDINLVFSGDHRSYLQVKKQITFSTQPGTELVNVLRQFVNQYDTQGGSSSTFVLVTTSTSSRKITTEMRSALEAFRLGDEESFRRDQPAETIAVVDELLVAIENLLPSGEPHKQDPKQLLRRMHVLILDLDPASSLEQAILLLLLSRSYRLPDKLWRKIIADSLNDAANRHTIDVDHLHLRYEEFRKPQTAETKQEDTNLLEAFIVDVPLSTGKEVLFGKLQNADGTPAIKEDFVIFELRRFDEECKERVAFKDGVCFLKNGMRIALERRTASYVGMERFLESRPDLTTHRSIVIVPRNGGDEDIERTVCAERRRLVLQAAHRANAQSLVCVHCGKPVSSANAELIEFSPAGTDQVGLTHAQCTRVDDRVVGMIKSELFERYSFLKNFNFNQWFRRIQRGQGFLRAGNYPPGAVFAWGGLKPALLQGSYMAEMNLEGGEVEYVHHRGNLQRLTKEEAEPTTQMFADSIQKAKLEGDPYCVSDQTKAFGKRSLLLRMLGVSERLREIVSTRVVKFDQKIADLYALWENWYAPIAYLSARDEEALIHIAGCIPLISNPLELGRYIENWKLIDVNLPEYDVQIVDTDARFDELLDRVTRDGLQVIVDPVFAAKEGQVTLQSGFRIVPMHEIGVFTTPNGES